MRQKSLVTQRRQSAAQHEQQQEQAARLLLLFWSGPISIHSHWRQDTQKSGEANR
jgi:hypothetical protein